MLSTDNYTQKLLGLEDVIITKVQRNLNETLIFIELPKKPHICHYCASITTRINNYRFQKIKDLEFPLVEDVTMEQVSNGKSSTLVLLDLSYLLLKE